MFQIFQAGEELMRRMMEVNLWGPVRLMQIMIKLIMRDNQERDKLSRNEYSIVNIGSLQSYFALPHRAACKSKTFPELIDTDNRN